MSATPQETVRIRPTTEVSVGRPLQGIVESHPFHSRGTEVVTSPVLRLEPGVAYTKTYRYELLAR